MSLPPLVFIDTETTGLDPVRDRVIDLAAVRVDDGLRITARFSTLIDPGIPIPLYTQRLTGIGPSEVRDAPTFAAAYRDYLAFVGDAAIVGQNVRFDLDFLSAEARRHKLRPPNQTTFDTLEASLLLYPELDRHGLDAMAAHLTAEPPTHRALRDAETTVALFKGLCTRAASLHDSERKLLTAIAWPPLSFLDLRYLALTSCSPTATGESSTAVPVAAGSAGMAGMRTEQAGPADGRTELANPAGSRPEPLSCEQGGWRDQFLEVDGLAARLPSFRARPGQVEFAAAVADVLDKGGIGLFEAGTGMGKSLAYLLPAAYAGAAAGERIVVSTKTKALQRQLASHDLPLIQGALPPGWRWALLMGRENYLCRRLLEETIGEATSTLPDNDRMLALAYLLGRTRLGEVDLSSVPYRAGLVLPALRELARELRSLSAGCLRGRCPTRARCYWRQARARAEAAHLVVVNHALLLTGGTSIPAFERTIIDEAHLLPGEAMAAFSRRLDWATVQGFLRDLGGKRHQRPLAARLRAAAAQLDEERQTACKAAADGLERAAADMPGHAAVLAAAIGHLVAAASAAEASSGYSRTLWLRPGLRELPAWDRFATSCGLLAEAMAALASAAALADGALPEEHRDAALARTLAAETGEAVTLLNSLPDLADSDSVCWAELDSEERWALTQAPFSAAAGMRAALWDRLRSAALTSATLSVGDSFAYFRDQAGLERDIDVVERIFASPFDYRRQAVLVLEHDPGVAYSREEIPGRQAARLRELVDMTGGRLLALFTNRREMEQVAAAVGEHVEDDGVVVLAQGVHGSAAALADEFRAHPSTVLLGVDTLWTGQDFPGDVLVCLVIAKLPFPRQDALFQARRQAAEEGGYDWFRRFYLPEAVLRFRQGFGRLIRTETDCGVIVVLDHRLTQKSYQRDFLDSLPDLPVVKASPAELPAVVADCLRRVSENLLP